MSNDNVLNFPEKNKDLTLLDAVKVNKGKSDYCRHDPIEVDADNRMITCRRCGSTVEPFDWVLRLTKKGDSYFTQMQYAKKELTETRRNIDLLKKEERNTKSRLKNARNRLKEAKATEFEVMQAKEQMKAFMKEGA